MRGTGMKTKHFVTTVLAIITLLFLPLIVSAADNEGDRDDTCFEDDHCAPTLGKGFSQTTISVGGVSTLTITLSNPNDSVATLNGPLIDTLPTGVVIAPTPNASTTCGGGTTVTAPAGGTTVTLPTGRSIPASSGGIARSCTVTVDVTAAIAGAYITRWLSAPCRPATAATPPHQRDLDRQPSRLQCSAHTRQGLQPDHHQCGWCLDPHHHTVQPERQRRKFKWSAH